MLQSIRQLYGNKLGASDGEIGHVKDFYFDDQTWAIRYVVADTGSWLTGRQVLISPHAFGGFHHAGTFLCVNLTRKQIENCPLIETHKPVSRQYEEEYYQYYGWPYYWQGNALWGMGGVPIFEPQPPLPSGPALAGGTKPERSEPHLRCTQAVTGYVIKATDGTAGHVSDFIMDAKSWEIRQLIIKTGLLLPGKELQIPTGKVDRISYEEFAVHVNMTRESVEKIAASPLTSEGAVDEGT